MRVKKTDVLKAATEVSKAARDTTYWLRAAGHRRTYDHGAGEFRDTTREDKLDNLRRAHNRACQVEAHATEIRRAINALIEQEVGLR